MINNLSFKDLVGGMGAQRYSGNTGQMFEGIFIAEMKNKNIQVYPCSVASCSGDDVIENNKQIIKGLQKYGTSKQLHLFKYYCMCYKNYNNEGFIDYMPDFIVFEEGKLPYFMEVKCSITSRFRKMKSTDVTVKKLLSCFDVKMICYEPDKIIYTSKIVDYI